MTIKKENEIDLVDLALIIWRKKNIFLITTFISLILAFTFLNFKKDTTQFKFETNLKPIQFFEENSYNIFNEILKYSTLRTLEYNFYSAQLVHEIYQIEKNKLLDLFIEVTKNEALLFNIVKSSDLIDSSGFDNEDDYNYAIEKITNSINIIDNGTKNQKEWKIIFEHKNLIQSEKFLDFFEKEINSEVQKILQTRYNAYINLLVEINKYIIEDLNKGN